MNNREGEQKIVINIGGMHCAMCVKTVEKAINLLQGVKQVYVNLSTEQANILYDPEDFSMKKLKRAIKKTGYGFLGLAG